MEMTPVDRHDKKVTSGDGATPHGRDLSSTGKEAKKLNTVLDPREIVKREIPVDQTAKTIAALLRRADPSLDAQTAHDMAKRLLESSPPIPHGKAVEEEPAVGRSLDVSA